MNKQNIKQNMMSSALICVLCFIVSGLCFWTKLTEIAVCMIIVGVFEALIFAIWFQRSKKAGTEDNSKKDKRFLKSKK